MRHPYGCNCGRCEGLRHYPEPSKCDWCNTVHAGDASNCYEEEEALETDVVNNTTVEDEKICWTVFTAVREITKSLKENQMIPAAQARSAQGSRSSQNQQVRTGLPYLNQKNMTDYLELDVKFPAKIIDCRVNDNANANQSPVVLKIAIKGKTVLWGLKLTNPSLDELTSMFGRNENDWAGKSFLMWLHEDDFDGKIWPTVGPVEEESKKKK
jgi:hypothetical protein